jgi:phosphoribosyl 1,2-cyclic phosphodiesterase
VHGDLVRKNLRINTTCGRQHVVAVDWENACFGIPAVDLAHLPGSECFPDFVASPDLVSYLEVVQHHWQFVDIETLEGLANMGALFRCLDALVWEIERLEANGYVDRCMQRIDIFTNLLIAVLKAGDWHD